MSVHDSDASSEIDIDLDDLSSEGDSPTLKKPITQEKFQDKLGEKNEDESQGCYRFEVEPLKIENQGREDESQISLSKFVNLDDQNIRLTHVGGKVRRNENYDKSLQKKQELATINEENNAGQDKQQENLHENIVISKSNKNTKQDTASVSSEFQKIQEDDEEEDLRISRSL